MTSSPGNRIVLVTGASHGIGRAIAQAFAGLGDDVVGFSLPRELERPETDADLDSGHLALSLTGDVADDLAVGQATATVMERFGRIDVLVTNAGHAEEAPIERLTPAQFERMLRVHVLGTFSCVRHVLPGMLARGEGTIITMASQLAYIGAENLTHYAAAKGAIVAFTKSLAREVARRGVRVNGIAPGPIETGILPANPEFDARLRDRLPLGRFGRPDEVAPTALFLASEASSYYVGQILGPNGGEVMP